MRIGDIEYTRRVVLAQSVINTAVREEISFAVGIKVRALLTRVQVAVDGAAVVTGAQGVWLENGNSIAGGVTNGALQRDVRAFPVYFHDRAISITVEGGLFGVTDMQETMWWKILFPQVTLHIADTTVAAIEGMVTLHYRFAELTDDEIIEIAAQRAQE